MKLLGYSLTIFAILAVSRGAFHNSSLTLSAYLQVSDGGIVESTNPSVKLTLKGVNLGGWLMYFLTTFVNKH